MTDIGISHLHIGSSVLNSTKSKVRSYIAENFIMGGGEPTFKDGDSFIENHIVDSTGFLELVTFLESTWGFVVEDAEMIPENLDSIDSIDAYVRHKTAPHSRAA